MSDLREQLARRLGDVMRPLPGREALATPDLLLAADEVIRQCRWQLCAAGEATRVIGPEAKEVPAAIWEQWAHIIETGPVTLAPEDWQP